MKIAVEREVLLAPLQAVNGAIEKKGLPVLTHVLMVGDGETVTGTFTGTVQLTSGKFAIVEKSHEFTLVPWRPVIDRQLGREVTGIVQGGSVSWQMGRQRGLEI